MQPTSIKTQPQQSGDRAVVPDAPTFAPMVDECRRHGISRSVAYQLAKDGLIETFSIGAKRYVIIESLRTLPTRQRRAAA